ncbi:MAG: UDP-N-acetylmuramoyl-tripeptide--D-alanyl-D-alanine ligase [Propionibacteriaceae bacterium]|jgi:UDP-N-acetylmuramoyl-tripeptide--D-alanyl-D-alanine ligase|nr:UDP-N-acetylmuramoyl-tripeptide--D-alanyl-D-alanine ligase [Propionibacteriaceae bacterium]
MEPISLADLSSIVGASLDPSLPADRLIGPAVVIDSRQAEPGCLFVALPGQRVDGHDYVAAAAARGARAAEVTRPTPAAGLAELVLADPLAGLTGLAGVLVERARPRLRVIGLTGSSGKTTTKDVLAQLLALDGPTVAPLESQNNDIGVPLTCCRVDRSTRYLVAELGARGPGHIADLCRIVRPEVGLVLNVGPAHLGQFGGPAQTAQAKGELIEALPSTGWAVLNADDPQVVGLARRGQARLSWFSSRGRPESGPVRLWASQIVAGPDQCHRFDLSLDDAETGRWAGTVQLRLAGRHQVDNALAAAGAAWAAGLAQDQILTGLNQARTVSRWRWETRRRPGGPLVVNDSYNANPVSMGAALTTAGGLLEQRRRERPGTRLCLVLGDMLELGDDSAAYHRSVGRQAARTGASRLLAVGQFADAILAGAAELGLIGQAVSDRDQALAALPDLGPDDILLIKASRGLGLERLAAAVLGEEGQSC